MIMRADGTCWETPSPLVWTRGMTFHVPLLRLDKWGGVEFNRNMKTLSWFIVVVALSLRLPAAENKVDFSKDIKPIFEQNCFKCHGEEKQKGKMRLDSKEAALKGGKTGP